MQQCDKRQDEFTSRDVEIISKESVFEGFFKMVKYRFKHKLFAGGW
ncbi:ADP-ribose pyrophosphatase, partial [Vibrio parahaemolyticus]